MLQHTAQSDLLLEAKRVDIENLRRFRVPIQLRDKIMMHVGSRVMENPDWSMSRWVNPTIIVQINTISGMLCPHMSQSLIASGTKKFPNFSGVPTIVVMPDLLHLHWWFHIACNHRNTR